MIVYLVGLMLRQISIPEAEILLQIFLLTTVQAIMMVAGAVVVSTQATSVRAANLLSSFIIIPVAFLIQWEALVMFWGNQSTLWWVVIGVSVLTILLIRVGIAHFHREELLGREIDVLKVRWAWGVFRKAFKGESSSVWEWYRRVLPRTVKKLTLPFSLVTGMTIVGLIIGTTLVDDYSFLIDPEKFKDAGNNLKQLMEIWPLFKFESVTLIWWQNVRVLLLAMVIGVFSFGVLGVLPLLATMSVAGYLLGLLSSNGLAVAPMAALLIPHGILEIPAAILATAAVLQAGAILATPTPDKTISEVWLTTMADWAKVMVGIIIPILLVAAMVEAWITPRIAVLVLGG
jgi:uncharacterized membrane protein SpoIIM required for sporulation